MLLRETECLAKPHLIRRHRRIPLRLPMTVSGYDHFGNPFEEFIETHEVSSEGGQLYSKRGLPVGSSLKLRAANGNEFVAEVIWVKDAFQNSCLIGFKLQHSHGDWVLQSNRRGRCILKQHC